MFLASDKKLFALWDNHEPLYTVGTGSKAGAMVKRNYIFLSGAMNSSTMASLAGALCDNLVMMMMFCLIFRAQTMCAPI